MLGALAASDLTARVTGEYQGGFGKLRDDTNAVADSLDLVMGKLRETSIEARASGEELVQETHLLSERTQHQNQAVTDTATAIGRLNAMVSANADGVQIASDRARNIGTSAEAGAEFCRAP